MMYREPGAASTRKLNFLRSAGSEAQQGLGTQAHRHDTVREWYAASVCQPMPAPSGYRVMMHWLNRASGGQ